MNPNKTQYAVGASPEEKRAESIRSGQGWGFSGGGFSMRECDNEDGAYEGGLEDE